MLYRIIISHHQSKFISLFPHDENNTIIVFDDITQDDVDTCSRLGYGYICASGKGNRGRNRNEGLQEVFRRFPVVDCDIVEFLDGDRYPINSYNTGLVERLIQDNALNCILYACSAHDTRLSKLDVKPYGVTILDTGTICNPFYSCGFAMTVKSIKEIMIFNGGHFFEPRFTGWGCEDQYMGLVCSKLAHKVAITQEISIQGNVGGDYSDHLDYKASLQTYINLILEKNIQIRH